MDVAIVYESLFGNTYEIAEAIAAGIREADPAAHVALMNVTDTPAGKAAGAGLLIVGGPTHIMRMSTQRSRQTGMESHEKAAAAKEQRQAVATAPAVPAVGVREWLAGLPAARPGSRAAAFDTRMSYPLAGGAARSIAKKLRRHGYQEAAKAAGFIVEGGEGPLRKGECDRAKAWAAGLLTRR